MTVLEDLKKHVEEELKMKESFQDDFEEAKKFVMQRRSSMKRKECRKEHSEQVYGKTQEFRTKQEEPLKHW